MSSTLWKGRGKTAAFSQDFIHQGAGWPVRASVTVGLGHNRYCNASPPIFVSCRFHFISTSFPASCLTRRYRRCRLPIAIERLRDDL
jgi:hypothetical protein